MFDWPLTITIAQMPKPMHPNEIDAAVAQYHAHGIYGWPLLGGGYQHVSDWAEKQRAAYAASEAVQKPL